MKYAKYGFLVLTLALVMGFNAQPAAAQQAFTGHFTLPAEAYWGATLLPPGEYSLIAKVDQTSTIHEVTVKGDGIRTSILTCNMLTKPVSNHSVLELEQINGVNVIRQLDAGLVGESFRFAVAKQARASAERASAAPVKSVPVQTSSAY